MRCVTKNYVERDEERATGGGDCRLAGALGSGTAAGLSGAEGCQGPPPGFLVSRQAGAESKLITDASRYRLGVMLFQDEGNRGWLPSGFANSKLRGAEERYTTCEKECLGVAHGILKFRHLLHGEHFAVVTDSKLL